MEKIKIFENPEKFFESINDKEFFELLDEFGIEYELWDRSLKKEVLNKGDSPK